MVKVMPPKDFLATMFPGSNTGAEYQPNDNAAAGGSGTGQLWDKEKSILLKKVAKLLDSRKRAEETEEEELHHTEVHHHHQVSTCLLIFSFVLFCSLNERKRNKSGKTRPTK